MKTIPVGPDRFDAFIELPWTLRCRDPLWVPPFRAAILRDLAGKSAFCRYAEMRFFLCESEGKPAGRIAAIHNPRLRDASGAPTGQLGYFESVDDPRVAASLFKAGMNWLRAQGAREAWGPMNGGAHREHRLMPRGFDRTPFLFEPRNPPYYPRLFEANGFRRLARWSSFDLARGQNERLLGMLRRSSARARDDFRVEPLDPGDAGGVSSRLHALLDGLWSGHVGYASLDLDEFAETFAPALGIMTAGQLGVVVDAGGRDVGCAFMYPDYADPVRALNGDAAGWGSWLGRERARRLVLHTVAVRPEVRGTGAAGLIMEHGAAHFHEGGYEEGVAALVVEEFRIFERILEPTREYALYAHPIT